MKEYGSVLKVVSSIREPRCTTRKEKQFAEVAGFPWNKPVVCFNWSTRTSTQSCPRKEAPNQSENGSRREQGCVEMRSSRQGKVFLTCIKCTTDCLSNLHDSDQISRGGQFLLKKWVLGDRYSTENFSPGDQNVQDQNSSDRTPHYFHRKYKQWKMRLCQSREPYLAIRHQLTLREQMVLPQAAVQKPVWISNQVLEAVGRATNGNCQSYAVTVQ